MAFLKAFGKFLPPRVISNVEIGARLGVEPAWIERVSGIVERRFAADDETVVDLAERAALHCLESAGTAKAEIGMLILASSTGERRFPGPAAAVGHRLGLDGIPALDLPIASAGSIFGICLAAQLISSHREVLVVAAEKLSPVSLVPPVEPGTAALFGDGAGACLVSSSGGIAEIRHHATHSDGSFADDLRLDFQGPVLMNGRSVILQASRKIPRCIQEVLEQAEIPASRVGTFILHQANRNLLDAVARALEVEPDRFYSNIRKYGNTSSASMLIAAAEWSESTGRQAGEPLVLAGFGAGFHWGALVAVGHPT